jgi:hypothetical protein
VDAENHSDYLMMIIFVLGSMCLMRWMYLGTPEPPGEMTPYQQTQEEKNAFPF